MAPASKSKKTDGKILLGPKTPGVHLALLLLQIGAMVTTAAVGELAAHLPLWGPGAVQVGQGWQQNTETVVPQTCHPGARGRILRGNQSCSRAQINLRLAKAI